MMPSTGQQRKGRRAAQCRGRVRAGRQGTGRRGEEEPLQRATRRGNSNRDAAQHLSRKNGSEGPSWDILGPAASAKPLPCWGRDASLSCTRARSPWPLPRALHQILMGHHLQRLDLNLSGLSWERAGLRQSMGPSLTASEPQRSACTEECATRGGPTATAQTQVCAAGPAGGQCARVHTHTTDPRRTANPCNRRRPPQHASSWPQAPPRRRHRSQRRCTARRAQSLRISRTCPTPQQQP